MNPTEQDWQVALAHWLAPFLDHLGHKARRRMTGSHGARAMGSHVRSMSRA
jgi:hypothetical protein